MSNAQKPLIHRNAGGRLELHCPNCHEELVSADIENFPQCPFCNCPLQGDTRLEDFILEPVVRLWTGKQQP